jgi:DNA-binding GntR family transcriptional regulator
VDQTALTSFGIIDGAVDAIRSAIMRGDLQPGQKLIEADLKDQLGISRPSLREALRRLEGDRLIEIVPNKGALVVRLDDSDIENIHEMWALLTGEMISKFAKRATARDLAEFKRAFEQLKQAFKSSDTVKQLDAINAFFHCASYACGNPILSQTVSSLVARINFLRGRSLIVRGWSQQCLKELTAVVDAVRAHDAPAARAAVQHHINSACEAAKSVTEASVIAPVRGKTRSARASTR